mgnify:FL=1
MQVHIIPDIQNLVLQLTSTLILFLIVRHFLYKPATELLAARSDKVYEEMAETKKQKEEAEATKREYEARLDQAKEESRTIVENAKQRGEQLKDEIIQEAKAEATQIKDKAISDIEREKEKVLDDLKSEVVDIAMLAASAVIEKDLDANTHKNMISKFIDEVGESKWKN